MKPHLISRRVNFDFRGMPVKWARNREFAASLDGGSPVGHVIEPYLNKVMARVRAQLGANHALLRKDISTFIKQESNHYYIHGLYNDELYAAGYTGLRQVGIDLDADLAVFLSSKSLRFNMAYCAAFENLTLFMAKFVFDEADDLFEGADTRGASLWRWHLAEEFEHRSVCHDAFRALSGNYFVRIHGLIYCMIHLEKFRRRGAKIILDTDRSTMSPAERAASVTAEKVYLRRFNRYVLPRMIQVFVPFYSPAAQKAPKGVEAALDHFERLSVAGTPPN